MRQFLSVFILLFMLALPARGQRASERAEAYIREGDSLLAAGEVDEARRLFNDALLADRDNPDALRRFGRLAAEAREWGDVRNRFRVVLDAAPEDLEAHYRLGIANRELGRARPPFVQEILEWRRARRHFETAISLDSTYNDILYQFALLKAYRGGQSRWKDALNLAARQIAARPDISESRSRLLALYIRYLERWNGPEQRMWLRGRSDAIGRAALARSYWIDGQMGAAREIAVECTSDERVAIPGFILLARMDYQLNRPDRAERYYQEAVDRIRGKSDALFLFEDFKYLLTDREFREWQRLSSADAYKSFVRRFWTKRNPLPASPGNPRLAEHYRRLLEADRSYVYYGYRGWTNNPDRLGYLSLPAVYDLNTRYNDKGLIFIRHGAPDQAIRTVSEVQNESWRYAGSGKGEEMVFHFLVEELTGGPGNWRLAARLPTADIVADRATWDVRYQSLANAMREAERDPGRGMDANLQELELIDESVADVSEGLQSDRHTWNRQPVQLPFWYRIFTSRGAEGLTRTEVFYLMPVNSIPVPDSTFDLETGVAFYTTDWEEAARRWRTGSYSRTGERSRLIMGSFDFSVPPDSYSVAIDAALKDTRVVAGWKVERVIDDYTGTDLQMSDLLTAFSIRPARPSDRFVRDGQQVLPNAAGRFMTDQPVWIHFEVYNLAFGMDDRANFSVTYTLRPEERRGRGLFRLFRRGSRPVLSIQYEREATETGTIEQGMLDAGNVDPGAYTLEVTITDNVSGQSATRSTPIELISTQQ